MDQWSNRPHNKFSHYQNSSFGSFTSDVLCRLQAWAVHVVFQLMIDELLIGTKQKPIFAGNWIRP